jgi:hypothetical protein
MSSGITWRAQAINAVEMEKNAWEEENEGRSPIKEHLGGRRKREVLLDGRAERGTNFGKAESGSCGGRGD